MTDDRGEDILVGGDPIATDGRVRSDGGREELNQLLRILSDHRRRSVLYYVRRNEITDIDELTRHVAGESGDVPKTRIDDEQFERTKARLIHSDLPQLREAGIVEYDRRNESIRYRDPSRVLTSLLRICAEFEPTSPGSE